MVTDRVQPQRFELKYIISEAMTPAIRDFVSSYLELDEYGAMQPNLSYPVHSIYLDSDDLRTYHETVNGTKNRFKLRLRYYDDRAQSPVYFEIKRRVNNCILKQRGAVKRDAANWLLSGHLPEPSHLFSPEPKPLVALERFCQLMSQLHASPKAHVSYYREAWVCPEGNTVRVTMDRGMTCVPHFDFTLPLAEVAPIYSFGKQVILEIKFTNRFPDWCRTLVRVFNLRQGSAAKYAEGVSVGGESRYRHHGAVQDWSPAPGEPQRNGAPAPLANAALVATANPVPS
jgi:hypothetical protein